MALQSRSRNRRIREREAEVGRVSTPNGPNWADGLQKVLDVTISTVLSRSETPPSVRYAEVQNASDFIDALNSFTGALDQG
jgi:hypothetical protein